MRLNFKLKENKIPVLEKLAQFNIDLKIPSNNNQKNIDTLLSLFGSLA